MTQLTIAQIREEFKALAELSRRTSIAAWDVRKRIFEMLEDAKNYTTRQAAIIDETFETFSLPRVNGGLARSTLSELYNYVGRSDQLREQFVLSGAHRLQTIASRNPWTAQLLAKDLREACRDDKALLAKVDASIHAALPA